jgi:hypothetical protein
MTSAFGRSGFERDETWQRRYLPAWKRILGEVLISEASFERRHHSHDIHAQGDGIAAPSAQARPRSIPRARTWCYRTTPRCARDTCQDHDAPRGSARPGAALTRLIRWGLTGAARWLIGEPGWRIGHWLGDLLQAATRKERVIFFLVSPVIDSTRHLACTVVKWTPAFAVLSVDHEDDLQTVTVMRESPLPCVTFHAKTRVMPPGATGHR